MPPRNRRRFREMPGRMARIVLSSQSLIAATVIAISPAGVTSVVWLRNGARRIAEQIADRRARGEVRRANARDGQFSEDLVTPRALSPVALRRRRDDHGLRGDRGLAQGARR